MEWLRETIYYLTESNLDDLAHRVELGHWVHLALLKIDYVWTKPFWNEHGWELEGFGCPRQPQLHKGRRKYHQQFRYLLFRPIELLGLD